MCATMLASNKCAGQVPVWTELPCICYNCIPQITCWPLLCRLKLVLEHFKAPRPNAKAFECARRLLGKAHMLEFFFCKKYPAGAGRYGDQWLRHVMLTAYAQGDFLAEWKKVGSKEMEHDTTDPHVGRFGVEPMHMTPSGHDLMYALDGFTVVTIRDLKQMGNFVYVAKGEVLPTYVHVDCVSNACRAHVSKQHYIMLTGPQGYVGCFAMKSASSLWKGREKHRAKKRQRTGNGSAAQCHEVFKWWFDRIPELLKAEHMPGREDPHAVRDRLAKKEWLVRSQLGCLQCSVTLH